MNRQAKEETVNYNLSKKTLRKMQRYHTEYPDETRNIRLLKKHVRQINRACTQIEKRFTSNAPSLAEENKKERNKIFMMTHLSFTDIEEQKVDSQQLLLKDMKKNISNNKMRATVGKSKDVSFVLPQEAIMSCFKLIDKIYAALI
jgi:hypothetical protein